MFFEGVVSQGIVGVVLDCLVLHGEAVRASS